MGISENLECDINSVSYNDDDILVLYTDGITEALDYNGNEFGIEKLKSLIVNNAGMSASKLKDHIINDLKSHHQSGIYEDDVTLVVVKMIKGESYAMPKMQFLALPMRD